MACNPSGGVPLTQVRARRRLQLFRAGKSRRLQARRVLNASAYAYLLLLDNINRRNRLQTRWQDHIT